MDEPVVWALVLTDLPARGRVAHAHGPLNAMIAPQRLKPLRLLRGSTGRLA